MPDPGNHFILAGCATGGNDRCMPEQDQHSPEAIQAAKDLLAPSSSPTGFDDITAASSEAAEHLPEVQNAIRAALSSAEKALEMATVINRVVRTSENKSFRGTWVAPAMDSLRASLLYASAGLDVSLKRLVHHALPTLADKDDEVGSQFKAWAETMMKNGQPSAVDAKSLVRILLMETESPRASLMVAWDRSLTDGSAQSAERVQELAKVLGVTDPKIKKRITPKTAPNHTILQRAFTERNKIAHELDVTDPDAAVRKPLETIRQRRSRPEIAAWCVELLDVTQLITNDVARRLVA